MEAVQIHTRAENGHVSFDLPAEHAALNNAKLLITLVGDSEAQSLAAEVAAPTKFPPTDWEKLEKALAGVVELNPYRAIKDPVQWQRDLRDEWERPLPDQP